MGRANQPPPSLARVSRRQPHSIFQKVPPGWIPRQQSEDERRQARQKLRRHFRRLGFRRIGRTRFDAMSLSQATPTLEDIVKPGR